MVDDLAHACPGRSHHGRPARPPRRRWPTSGRRPHCASGAGRPPGPGGPNFNKAGPRAHGLGGSSPPGGTHGSSPPCSWSSRCWPARSRPTHPWTRGLALAAPRGSAAGQERSDFCRCPAVRERSPLRTEAHTPSSRTAGSSQISLDTRQQLGGPYTEHRRALLDMLADTGPPIMPVWPTTDLDEAMLCYEALQGPGATAPLAHLFATIHNCARPTGDRPTGLTSPRRAPRKRGE